MEDNDFEPALKRPTTAPFSRPSNASTPLRSATNLSNIVPNRAVLNLSQLNRSSRSSTSVLAQCFTPQSKPTVITKNVGTQVDFFDFERMSTPNLRRTNLDEVFAYTGLSVPVFAILVQSIRTLLQFNTGFALKSSALSLNNQVFLTITKLRHNFSQDHLAFLFGISQSSVSNIFNDCIDVLATIGLWSPQFHLPMNVG